MTKRETLDAAIERLYEMCGQGLHIDNDGSDYAGLSAAEQVEFDRLTSQVFELAEELGLEPYEEVLRVMSR